LARNAVARVRVKDFMFVRTAALLMDDCFIRK